MTTPLNHAQTYMRLVSSQLAIPTVEFNVLDNSPQSGQKALTYYLKERRAAIAGVRRKNFHIAGSDYLNLPLRSLEQARLERHGL